MPERTDWSAQNKMREYNSQVPQAWRNQAEWITVYLLEQVVAELREIRCLIAGQPGVPVLTPQMAGDAALSKPVKSVKSPKPKKRT